MSCYIRINRNNISYSQLKISLVVSGQLSERLEESLQLVSWSHIAGFVKLELLDLQMHPPPRTPIQTCVKKLYIHTYFHTVTSRSSSSSRGTEGPSTTTIMGAYG